MVETVDDLRNEIRVSVGRFEREISATFTKEDLPPICAAVAYGIDTDSLPAKSQMRAGILERTTERAHGETDSVDRAFRKDELEAIAAGLDE